MRSIDVRDLEQRTAELLREVRDRDAPHVVKDGDELVALLSPLTTHVLDEAAEQRATRTSADDWESFARLAARLREAWPADRTSPSLLNEMRR